MIDLRQGQVVRAVRGERQHYRPVVSRLCGGAEPLLVAQALLAHTRSPRLYIADLDALTGGAPQAALVAELLDRLPGIEAWVDAGFTERAAADHWRAALGAQGARTRCVYASESLRSRAALAEALPPGTPDLLSLDQRQGQAMDPGGCWAAPELWPDRVIVMTLDRVGSAAGPDLDTLRMQQARAPGRRWIGSGGIRDAADLQAAAATGAEGWLVASALHDGRL